MPGWQWEGDRGGLRGRAAVGRGPRLVSLRAQSPPAACLWGRGTPSHPRGGSTPLPQRPLPTQASQERGGRFSIKWPDEMHAAGNAFTACRKNTSIFKYAGIILKFY